MEPVSGAAPGVEFSGEFRDLVPLRSGASVPHSQAWPRLLRPLYLGFQGRASSYYVLLVLRY